MHTHTENSSLVVALRNDEGSLIIEALAECPFKHVFDLIGRLNRQANAALKAGTADKAVDYEISTDDARLIVSALGNLPFNRVHALLQNLQAQMQRQGAPLAQDGNQ